MKLGSFRHFQFSQTLETEEETWNQLRFLQAMFDSAEPPRYFHQQTEIVGLQTLSLT